MALGLPDCRFIKFIIYAIAHYCTVHLCLLFFSPILYVGIHFVVYSKLYCDPLSNILLYNSIVLVYIVDHCCRLLLYTHFPG